MNKFKAPLRASVTPSPNIPSQQTPTLAAAGNEPKAGPRLVTSKKANTARKSMRPPQKPNIKPKVGLSVKRDETDTESKAEEILTTSKKTRQDQKQPSFQPEPSTSKAQTSTAAGNEPKAGPRLVTSKKANTARKSMRPPQKPNIKPKEKKLPERSLSDEEYDRIFATAIKPSPIFEKPSSRIEERQPDFTASDKEDSDNEIDKIIKYDDSTETLTSSQTENSTARQVLGAPLKSLSNVKKPFRGFPARKLSFSATKRGSAPETSRERFDVESTKSDEQSTPATVPALKRPHQDYADTPVSRFARKKQKIGTEQEISEHEDKENAWDSKLSADGRKESVTSPSPSYGSAHSEVSRRSRFSDISNSGVVSRASPQPKRARSADVVSPESYIQSPRPASATASVTAFAPLAHSQPSSAISSPRRDSILSATSSQESTFSLPSLQMGPEKVMEWLLPRRMVGTWVQCDGCKKWRHIKDIHDPSIFPDKWYCRNNSDPSKSNCDAEEDRPHLKEAVLMIYNEYAPGSVVWARVDGYPWWPAIVDDDVDYFQYYWMDNGASEKPTQYHVIFFDEHPSRAWVPTSDICPFSKISARDRKGNGYGIWARRIKSAEKKAETALRMNQEARLRSHGFLAHGWKLRNLASKRALQKPAKKSTDPIPAGSDRSTSSDENGSASLSEIY